MNLNANQPILDAVVDPQILLPCETELLQPSFKDPQEPLGSVDREKNLSAAGVEPQGDYDSDITSRYSNENLCWTWRSIDSTEEEKSQILSQQSQLASFLDDSFGQDISDKADSQFSLNKDLKELRIKSKRGRPRKNLKYKENKSFKIPLRHRSWKNQPLKVGPIQFSPQGVDEASAILETGLEMGLILEKDRNSAISEIKERLNI